MYYLCGQITKVHNCDRLYQSYLDLFAFLEKEGYSIVGAPRACYVDGMWNQEDADKWLTIIQVPVEKA